MIAKNLIIDDIPPIKPRETMEKALNWMDEFKISHLPVVDNKFYYGLVSDSMIYDFNDAKSSISKLNLVNLRPKVYEDEHLYKVMELISKLKLTTLPVLDKEDNYLGLITLSFLITTLSSSTSFSEHGSVIILEINQIDYTLAQIAQIIESNDAKILSSYISTRTNSKKVEVTIKINKDNIDGILQTFTRYDYNVIAVFSDKKVKSEVQSRYEELMKYLKI
jgi:acetoin utilization protein AcuB